ncbi:hypothetical protein BDF22DRAFT_466812 [Syncephalis plumigaleata]|nr:hypothetical protein BDF22DRAFT_466812 [Syncephalis plumigaleata]
MPVIDYSNPDDMKRIRSLEEKYGMLFDEMPELTISDFYMMAAGDVPEQRNRLLGIQLEMFILLFIFCLFSRNLIKLSRALMSNPCALPLWCSFISSFSGMATEGTILIGLITSSFNCKIYLCLQTTGMSLSMFFNSIILLRKAYLMSLKNNWVLYVGIPLIIPQLAYPVVWIYYGKLVPEVYLGCTAYYTHVILWFWAGVNIPHTILFSAFFCHRAYNQYVIFGSDIWKRLMREGIQTMCFVLLCNLVSIIVIVFYTCAVNKDMFLVIDWVIVTTILANHCCNSKNKSPTDRKPRTEYLLHVSQIDTAH